MLQSQLNEILDSHELWVKDSSKGKKADLSYQDLSGLDFSNRNLSFIMMRKAKLSRANFENANLSNATLSYANLSLANLYFANLSNANLSYVNLSHANLSRANLSRANLSSAYLSNANLSYANLSSAYLSNANLSSAYLSNAYLSSANLSYVNLSEAKLSYANISGTVFYCTDFSCSKIDNLDFSRFSICPEEGQFYGFKKVQDDFILKILISKHAKRINPISYRNCRASKVKVIEAYNPDGSNTNQTKFQSFFKPTFEYEIGKWIEVKDFNDDIREKNVPGIHFFLTKKEAMEY